MSIEDISSSDPAPGNVAAPIPTRREGKDVVPSIEHGDDGISESTASITQEIMKALAKDIQQLAQECSEFKNPAPENVAPLTRAWREGKNVVPSIKHQLGYVMSSKTYAQDLQKEVGKLTDEIERVHSAAEDARNNLWNVDSHVTEWQASAEKALKEAQNLLGNFEVVSKNCCYGTLPDPSIRYQFSRKAKDKIEDLQRLTREGSEFKDISFINPTQGNVAAPTPARREGKDVIRSTTATAYTSSASTSIKLRDDDVFKSRASMIKDIRDALADNLNSVVGVHGMGGVGKSTLLADAEKRIREEKSFDLVAKADVSEPQDIKRIQEEIAHALGLSDEIKKKESISLRAELLRERLEKEEREKRKVLIILDNLWEGLDLNKVGIPCEHDNKVTGRKLLLTSRDRDVLRREMQCDRDFLLGGLQEEEARRLFGRMVGDKVHDVEFKPLVDETLHKCAGLPFLIVEMATLFKDADKSEWEDVLKQIEMAQNKRITEVINNMLQPSYDHLKVEEAKSLLQLCVVYSVSMPSLENLVRYSMGLGLFGGNNSVEEARNRLSSLIHILQASSLLLEIGDGDGFMIRDLVREFVASIASRDQPLLVLKDKDKFITELPKDELKNCRAMCFPYVDMKELPEELDCPELQIFLLFTNNESLNIPDSLFNSMRKLMVLNLTGIRLTRLPLSFQLLKDLHTLCLDSCVLDDVAILGELKGLQILSFANSKIQRLPKEIGQLAELRLLDLNHCSRLQIIEPDVLGSLIKLEELYMENSFDQWNAMEQAPPINASLIELNNMRNLCTLYVCILNPTVLPDDLDVKKLTKYGIRIGGRCWSSHKGSRTLELKLNPIRDILRKGCIRTTLDKTDDLYLDELNEIKQSICELFPEGYPNVKHLHVENSPSAQFIFRQAVFPSLETLNITNMCNIEMIWDNQVHFRHLKILDVSHCDRLTYMFTPTIVGSLVELTKLRISNCKMLTEVINNEGGKEGHVVAFNQLKFMELDGLTGLRCFSSGGYTLMFPLLEDVIVTRCLNMKFFSEGPIEALKLEKVQASIAAWFWKGNLNITVQNMYEEMFMRLSEFPELIEKWQSEHIPIEPFLKLETLVVDRCPSFINPIPSILMLALHNMRSLQVRDCKSLEEIFDLERLEGAESTQVLPQLCHLGLVNLPKLRRLGNTNLQGRLRFNSLSHLTLYKCNNLRHAFAPSMIRCLATLEYMEIKECGQMEGVIADEEGYGRGMAKFTFPNLWWMELEYLPNLTTIFSRDNHMLECPCLKWLTIAHCPRMRDFNGQSSMEISAAVRHILQAAMGNPTPKEKKLVVLSSLETFHITGMDNIDMIWNNQVAVNSFYNLRSLFVRECNKIKCIWNKDLYSLVNFKCLRSVSIFRCKSLTSLFQTPVATFLVLLEELEINECGIVELIHEEGIIERVVTPKLTSFLSMFPKLTSLRLKHLPELKRIYSGTHASHWPALKTLEVDGCNKVEILASQLNNEMPLQKQALFLIKKVAFPIFKPSHVPWTDRNLVPFPSLETLHITGMYNIEMIWDNKVTSDSFLNLRSLFVRECNKLKCIWDKEHHRQVKFQCLRSVSIFRCKSLTSLFPAPVVRDLTQLEELEINECGIVELIQKEELVPRFVFPKLTSLRLKHLPELKCIYSGTHASHWPALKTLEVDHCNKVEILASQLENEMPLQKQPLFLIEKVSFPSLETLHIIGMYNIEMIWDNQVASDSFHNLRSLFVRECNKLKCIWDKELHRQVKFQCLRSISIFRCESLTSLFPASLVRDLTQLEELEINECGIVELIQKEEQVLRFVFPKLTSLRLKDLPRFKCIYSGTHASHWPALKTLVVDGCTKVEILASQLENEMPLHKQPLFLIEKAAFPSVETLHITSMYNIEMIWDNQVASDSFHNLRSLFVRECNMLKCIWDKELHRQVKFQCLCSISIFRCESLTSLFPASVVKDLTQLEELEINECGIVELIQKEELVLRFVFPKLTSLRLKDLPRFECIYNGTHASHWPALKTLEVDGCNKVEILASQTKNEMPLHKQPLFLIEKAVFPSLETLNITSMRNIKMIWHNQVYFPHLKTLSVSHCHRLTYMFTPTIAQNLVELTKLRISNCKMLTEVINNEGGKEGHVVAFNQLQSMELDGLTGLRCFSSGGYTLMFPLLEDVIVTRCLNMKFFSEGPIEALKLEKVQASIAAWFWKGNLNITIQNMYEEMATVIGVKFMRLSEFPELIEKWQSKLIPIEPFLKLETLVVDKGPSFINAIPSILMLALHNMRSLQVRDCESLEEIFDLEGLEGAESTQVLPQLWHLGLVNLPKLRRLGNTNLQGRLRFNSLSHLTLYKCSNLRHVFAPSMIWCLATLEYMEIKECGQMEGVFADEEGYGSGMVKFTFPNLWWMELEYLPNLTSFLSGKNHTLECPDLIWLTIAHCPRLRSFGGQSLMEKDNITLSLFTPQVAFPSSETLHITRMDNIEMIWDNQVYLQHLKTLDVSQCDRLSNMFTPTIAENLVELVELRISNCKMLTEVISDEGGKEGHVGASNQLKKMELDWLRCFPQKEGQGSAMKTIRFPNLHRVELECLPNLTNFLSGNNYTLEWPMLEELTIANCPNMTRIGTLLPRPPSLLSRLCTDIQKF